MEENAGSDGTVLPRCFFDVAIDGEMMGRIVFELFSNICPKTCENFKVLCTGEKSTSQHLLHYKNSPFHRIVKNFMIQGGDFVNGNGTGGESIYGHVFPDENFTLKHDREFLLSMANKGPNTNGSQFFILTKPSPHLDGLHVVFGRVVNADGKRIVKMVEAEKVDENYRPFRNVTIFNSGELVLLKKAKSVKRKKHDSKSSSPNSESSSESGSEKRERRKAKKDKKKKSKKSKNRTRSSEKNEKPDDAEDFVCSVRPDEIPPVPSHKFLGRYSGQHVETSLPQLSTGGPPPLPRERNSTNARVVKGRGNFRYNPVRSPSPDERYDRRDRHRTSRKNDVDDEDDEPAHWRSASQRTVPFDIYQRRMKNRQEREMIEIERTRIIADQRRHDEKRLMRHQLKNLDEEERKERHPDSHSTSHERRHRESSRTQSKEVTHLRSRSPKKRSNKSPSKALSDSRSRESSSSEHHKSSPNQPARTSPSISRSRSRDRQSSSVDRSLNSKNKPRKRQNVSRSRSRSSSQSDLSSSTRDSRSRTRSRDRSWRR